MSKEPVDATSLPPRRVRHPKPKSMIDNPRFPFVMFLAFLTILGVIFFSYYYTTKPVAQQGDGTMEAENGISENGTEENKSGSERPLTPADGKPEASAGDGNGLNGVGNEIDESKNNHNDNVIGHDEGGNGQNGGGNKNAGNSWTVNADEPAKPEPAESSVTPPASDDRKAGENKTQTPKQQKVIRYTVQPGDTLFSIAMKFYGSQDGIRLIQSANRLSGEKIYAGMRIRIPNPKKSP